jgi:hypothetical protein
VSNISAFILFVNMCSHNFFQAYMVVICISFSLLDYIICRCPTWVISVYICVY